MCLTVRWFNSMSGSSGSVLTLRIECLRQLTGRFLFRCSFRQRHGGGGNAEDSQEEQPVVRQDSSTDMQHSRWPQQLLSTLSVSSQVVCGRWAAARSNLRGYVTIFKLVLLKTP